MRRRSLQTRIVLQAFVIMPSEETYGYALSKATGLPSGVIYPILRRLVEDGLLAARWESVDGRDEARRRRFYRLTGEGRRIATSEPIADPGVLWPISPGQAIV
jgi:PadR family transcriptional regulator, regulatory protein PadR